MHVWRPWAMKKIIQNEWNIFFVSQFLSLFIYSLLLVFLYLLNLFFLRLPWWLAKCCHFSRKSVFLCQLARQQAYSQHGKMKFVMMQPHTIVTLVFLDHHDAVSQFSFLTSSLRLSSVFLPSLCLFSQANHSYLVDCCVDRWAGFLCILLSVLC